VSLQALTGNSVSVFEMITSGAVSRLTEYLQGKDLSDSTQQQEQLLCRLRKFTSVALAAHDQQQDGSNGSNADAAAAAAGGGAAAAAVAAASSVPLTALVRKLQGALASSEAFPVLCSRLVSSSGALGGSGRSLSRSAGMSGSFNRSTLSSGLHALTQPFKLRLVRHDQVRATTHCCCHAACAQPSWMHYASLVPPVDFCAWCMHRSP
jgi:E3 ubiquitin-protein ligase TRIP12